MIDFWEFFCPYERTPRRERRLHKSHNAVAICWEAGHHPPYPPAMFSLTPYPITPIGSFIGFVLALLPLPLQLARRNHGVFMYGLWIAAFDFQMFVNSIIWHDNTRPAALVWCDIGKFFNLYSWGLYTVADGRFRG